MAQCPRDQSSSRWPVPSYAEDCRWVCPEPKRSPTLWRASGGPGLWPPRKSCSGHSRTRFPWGHALSGRWLRAWLDTRRWAGSPGAAAAARARTPRDRIRPPLLPDGAERVFTLTCRLRLGGTSFVPVRLGRAGPRRARFAGVPGAWNPHPLNGVLRRVKTLHFGEVQ